LCGLYRPTASGRGDEQLLRERDFSHFVHLLSCYRTQREAEALIARWGERYGVEIADPRDEILRFLGDVPSGLDREQLVRVAAGARRRRY
jgi:hypothetical protein